VFDHVTVRVSDREAAERFYDTVLPAIGPEHDPDYYGAFLLDPDS
jgi:catechol 2,3-dioxygenase-like lactoylglutathione lyase family enzyme